MNQQITMKPYKYIYIHILYSYHVTQEYIRSEIIKKYKFELDLYCYKFREGYFILERLWHCTIKKSKISLGDLPFSTKNTNYDCALHANMFISWDLTKIFFWK